MRLSELMLSGNPPGGAAVWPASGNPADILGMKLWLQSDAGVTTDAFGVTEWANQVPSGGYSNPTQTTDANKPALTASQFPSGKAAIEPQDTADQVKLSSQQTIAGAFSLILALHDIDTSVTDEWIGGAGGNSEIRVSTLGRITCLLQNISANSAVSDTENAIICVYRDGSGNFKCYKNDSDITSGSPNTLGDWTTLFIPKGIGITNLGVVGLASGSLEHLHSNLWTWLSSWSGIT